MRPDCRECNKQLPKYTWLLTHMGQELTDDQVEEKARERYGDDYQGITHIRRWARGAGPYVSVDIWLGKYGWAGCGYFCSQSCAAYWAVSKARREARSQVVS